MHFDQTVKRLLAEPLVVLDTETTGFNYSGGDEVIELAGAKVVNDEIIDTFHELILPTRPVPVEAIGVHGITNEHLASFARPQQEVFPEFASFISGTVLVGHNIRRFDYPFIATHFIKLGLNAPGNDMLDTLEMSRRYLSLRSNKLGNVAAHFGIASDGAHRADRDVEITLDVLRGLAAHVDKK